MLNELNFDYVLRKQQAERLNLGTPNSGILYGSFENYNSLPYCFIVKVSTDAMSSKGTPENSD